MSSEIDKIQFLRQVALFRSLS
ncbi:MAG: hypothetical protein PWR01_4003, partial [Clostridiales bacterium]|nr:hypothetical protein [Clostridiales bacterium]MDN5282930.1 hypothetical protein [Candidatus Ozemobacter sp.]